MPQSSTRYPLLATFLMLSKNDTVCLLHRAAGATVLPYPATPRAMSLTVSIHNDTPDRITVHPDGILTAATAPILEGALTEELEGATHSMVIDLARVSMLDSTGLGAIVRTKKNLNAHGLEFGLIHPQPTAAKVFEIMKLSSQLNVFANRQELDAYLIGIQQKMISDDERSASQNDDEIA